MLLMRQHLLVVLHHYWLACKLLFPWTFLKNNHVGLGETGLHVDL